MELGPIWRSLTRNKAGSVLIALQIAVTLAIMVNAIAIMQERAEQMGRPSGTDEANIFTLSSTAFVPDTNIQSLIEEDLKLIRSQPGVVEAIATNSFPLRQGGSARGFQLEPGAGKETLTGAVYYTDEHAIEAFGTHLVDGANFAPNQVVWGGQNGDEWPANIIITESFAKTLFPDTAESAIGKTVFVDDTRPVQIIGIIDRLQAPWRNWGEIENTVIVPLRQEGQQQWYLVRTEPGAQDRIMPEVEELLAQSNKNRIIQSVRTMQEVRDRSYLSDNAMIKMLGFIVTLLILITGLGIVGLASFNVSRRTRQIGIRRALGATRAQVINYFRIENLLISGLGIAVGAVLAIALNLFLVNAFSLTPMSWYVIPLAMLAMWVVGQIAVIGPARRASRISPAIATRSG
ncbi:MAG TPA: ABC transporter permease [Woeseiaceae bacterium]|nr:ABC transporter permease [Woeseiaceae bacterium]